MDPYRHSVESVSPVWFTEKKSAVLISTKGQKLEKKGKCNFFLVACNLRATKTDLATISEKAEKGLFALGLSAAFSLPCWPSPIPIIKSDTVPTKWTYSLKKIWEETEVSRGFYNVFGTLFQRDLLEKSPNLCFWHWRTLVKSVIFFEFSWLLILNSSGTFQSNPKISQNTLAFLALYTVFNPKKFYFMMKKIWFLQT